MFALLLLGDWASPVSQLRMAWIVIDRSKAWNHVFPTDKLILTFPAVEIAVYLLTPAGCFWSNLNAFPPHATLLLMIVGTDRRTKMCFMISVIQSWCGSTVVWLWWVKPIRHLWIVSVLIIWAAAYVVSMGVRLTESESRLVDDDMWGGEWCLTLSVVTLEHFFKTYLVDRFFNWLAGP